MKIELNTGRRLAISDIHGCYFTLESLLQKVNLQKEDNLFILGDMINRGKYSKKVIKLLLKLQKNGYSVFPLRGNHEQYLIAEIKKKTIENLYPYCEHHNLLWIFHEGTKVLKRKYEDFFNSLPFYYNLEDCILSHAGFDFCSDSFENNTYAMICQRNFNCIDKIPQNLQIIHGHTPISLNTIKQSIVNRNQIINIDNGCVYKSIDNDKGNLVCLDIDSYELFIQENID